MDERTYQQIAGTIPDEWYTAAEAKETAAGIFYDIMIGTAIRSGLVITDQDDYQQLLSILSKEKNVPITEVIGEIKNIALTVGAVQLFNQKYPAIAARFPLDDNGNPDYPAPFLAKVLGVDDAIAAGLLEGVLKEYSVYLSPPIPDAI
jgi:hypothetical protein